jgi:hypothetical protein
MRAGRLPLFVVLAMGAGLTTPCYAQGIEPQTGSYVISGKVSAVTAEGGAGCLSNGAAIQGYSYFPGVQGKGENFTIVIPAAGAQPSVVYYFPPMNTFSGSNWFDVLTYALPPSAVTRKGNFGLRFTAYNASSFSIILQTSTSSQGAGPVGSTCLTTYSLNFSLGFPTKLF